MQLSFFGQVIRVMAILLISGTVLAQPKPIEPPINENDIKVTVTKDENTSLNRVKIETVISASLESVSEAITHIPNFEKWLYKCEESKLLKTIDSKQFIYYLEVDMPYPIENRDIVIHSQFWTDEADGSFRMVSKSKNDFLKTEPGLVRVEEFESSWRLAEISSGKTSLVYTNKIDPGGSLPTWAINLAGSTGPTKSITQLKEMLE